MTRILVDLTHLHPAGISGGIKPALLELLGWLAGQPDLGFEFVYVVDSRTRGEIEYLTRPVDRLVEARPDLPRDCAARAGCDVVYCPLGATDLACPGIPVVTLIVDVLHRDFPATVPPEEAALRESWFGAAAERTDLFQVISDYTGQQLALHYRIPGDRVVRTYLPIHGRLGAPGTQARRNFFFYPANAWLHKDHATLLTAYQAYAAAAGTGAWDLVLTGADDARMHAVRERSAQLGLATRVRFEGYVDEARLAELWRTAGALVFPSRHEGFGIPLLEAMAHSVPIIAARATAIPEVVADAARLFEAGNVAALAAALADIARDARLRAELAALGQARLHAFDRDTEFGRLAEAFHAVASSPARWSRSGFHEIDGLTDPRAIFALPGAPGQGTLRLSLRPLPAERTFEIWSGPDRIARARVPAFQAARYEYTFTARSPSLSLVALDANRLAPTDPRTHGLLIGELEWIVPGRRTALVPRRP